MNRNEYRQNDRTMMGNFNNPSKNGENFFYEPYSSMNPPNRQHPQMAPLPYHGNRQPNYGRPTPSHFGQGIGTPGGNHMTHQQQHSNQGHHLNHPSHGPPGSDHAPLPSQHQPLSSSQFGNTMTTLTSTSSGNRDPKEYEIATIPYDMSNPINPFNLRMVALFPPKEFSVINNRLYTTEIVEHNESVQMKLCPKFQSNRSNTCFQNEFYDHINGVNDSITDHVLFQPQRFQRNSTDQNKQFVTSSTSSNNKVPVNNNIMSDMMETEMMAPPVRPCFIEHKIPPVEFHQNGFFMYRYGMFPIESQSIWRIDAKKFFEEFNFDSIQNGRRCYASIGKKRVLDSDDYKEYFPIDGEIYNNVFVVSEKDLPTYKTVFNDYSVLRDIFITWLQILLSQALDSTFIEEISKINDDYFKPALEIMSAIFNAKFHALCSHSNLMDDFKEAIENYNTLFTSTESDNETVLHITLKGDIYDKKTMEIISNDTEKCFKINKKMHDIVTLCHDVAHMKYHFYVMCREQVHAAINELGDLGEKLKTEALKYCLDNEQWIDNVFKQFQQTLLRIDEIVYEQ
ncbi:hypothetical protein SNEBB_005363 [Seison nebaliae]|nr:hypothetical protein SNEBB_005363 [Seison nebaliae]